MNEYPDNELVNLVCENSEEANDVLYDKYNYIIEDSLGKAINNNRARELANKYNQLTDKMIETEKKIGGIQKLALNDLSKSESGYIRMRGGEQQTVNYNNLIKQYQLMAIKQNNIINELKNIKNII